MNKRVKRITMFLCLALILILGITSASAEIIKTESKKTSGSISLAGKVKIYQVKYALNGGSGEAPVDADRYTANSKAKALGSGSMVAPKGKTFAGWATVANAKEANVKPGDTIQIVKGDVQLYAVWSDTVKSASLTYYNEKGDGVVFSCLEGEKVEIKSLTSLGWSIPSGYAFLGWATTKDGTPSFDAGDTAEIKGTENKLYAIFTTDKTAGTTEFTVKVIWDDAGNLNENRLLPSDIKLTVKGNGKTYSNPIWSNTSSNTWTAVFTALPMYDESENIIAYEVDKDGISNPAGYSVTIAGASVTYRKTVSSVTLKKWITNKKWDKGGELIKFKSGQRVEFRIDVTNNGNETVKKVQVYETLKNCKIKSGSGYKVTSEGHAFIGDLAPGETVYVYASYRVTNSDTRKSKVSNVAGVDYQRQDGSWGDTWDAVRIPINKNSATSSSSSSYTYTVTPTPVPTITPLPGEIYMVERLLKDETAFRTANLMNNVREQNIEIVGEGEVLTPDEYLVFETLNEQDQLLTLLTAIGFDDVVAVDRIRLNLVVSEPAKQLMNTIIQRRRNETAEEKANADMVQNVYFPRQAVTVNGYQQEFFEISLKETADLVEKIEKYTFRRLSNGEWGFERLMEEIVTH